MRLGGVCNRVSRAPSGAHGPYNAKDIISHKSGIEKGFYKNFLFIRKRYRITEGSGALSERGELAFERAVKGGDMESVDKRVVT